MDNVLEVLLCEHGSQFWLHILVNGKSHGRIDAVSREDAERLKADVEQVLTSVYKTAYHGGMDAAIACWPQ